MWYDDKTIMWYEDILLSTAHISLLHIQILPTTSLRGKTVPCPTVG